MVKRHEFDRERVQGQLGFESKRLFAILLIASLVAQFFVHIHDHFGLDGTMFFHAWYGFLACVVIVIVSKLLGKILKRHDDYYEKDNTA